MDDAGVCLQGIRDLIVQSTLCGTRGAVLCPASHWTTPSAVDLLEQWGTAGGRSKRRLTPREKGKASTQNSREHETKGL